MPDETTYYADKCVRVTNARAILDNKTYAMANITSVSLTSEEPNRLWSGCLVLAGIVFLIVGFILLISTDETGWASLVFGAFVGGLGILWWREMKPKYRVTLGSASGENHALASTNREYVEQIVNAMNEAIIERG